MLRALKGPAASILLLGLAIILSGCLSGRTDLVDQDYVRLTKEDGNFVYISNVFVYNENNGTAIEGRVRRRLCSPGHIQRGHMVIEIVDPDGRIIENLVAQPYPQDIPCRGSRTSAFAAETKAPIPEDSLVRIQYKHGSPGETDSDGTSPGD